MIENIVREFLKKKLRVSVHMEYPRKPGETFVVLRKADTSRENRIEHALFVTDSYARTMFETAELNEQVKDAVDALEELDVIAAVNRGSDYPAFDNTNKRYRYQATFEITHY